MDTGAVINNVNTNNYRVKESDNEDNNNINHYLSALHAIQASFLPMVLHAAVELNVFDILAKTDHGNGLTVKEISNELSGCRNPDAPMFLDRMLRLLASHSMVSCTIWPTNDGGSERRYGLSPISKFFVGVHHIGGDMFASVPQGDAILLKWVLQVWNDENCIKVLENCYKSIPNNGKVIIMEEIVPDQPEATNVAQIVSEIDAYLMIKNPGGRLRTFKEFVDLGTIVGFKGITLIGNVAELTVLEFYKS
ncbi:cathecol O-methyltransferase 1-like [Silene latifolia]|uniref:cathecol O-methyltransferase 1-like n=1 Tax=Silene latifolia TaxID=37657 RepID=UPI003D76E4CE